MHLASPSLPPSLPPSSQLLPATKQREFHDLLSRYFSALSKHLLVRHKEMHRRERKNRQILQAKGELTEERKADNEAAQKSYDKMLTSSSTLAVRKPTEPAC